MPPRTYILTTPLEPMEYLYCPPILYKFQDKRNTVLGINVFELTYQEIEDQDKILYILSKIVASGVPKPGQMRRLDDAWYMTPTSGTPKDHDRQFLPKLQILLP